MIDIKNLVSEFLFSAITNNTEIYNEFSFQHELGIYLRAKLPNYKIQFERNADFFIKGFRSVKKEIDIVVFSEDRKEKYAIELKYPRNGQYPETMVSVKPTVPTIQYLKIV